MGFLNPGTYKSYFSSLDLSHRLWDPHSFLWNGYQSYVISGLHREVDENCALLRYYAASSGYSLPTFRDNLSSRLQDSWHLKMEPVGCAETSVRNYHHSLRSDLQDRSSRVPRFFPRVKSTEAWFWSHLHLALRLRIRSVLPPLPLPVCLLGVDGDKFTFFKNLFTCVFSCSFYSVLVRTVYM